MIELLQAVFDGLALGARYSLIVLGFVIIYRATGIINFAQGGFVLVGAYLAYNAINTWDLNFWIAVPVSMLLTAGLGVLMQRSILQLTFRESAAAVSLLLGWAVAQYNGQTGWAAFGIGVLSAVVVYVVVRLVEQRAGASKFNELPIFGAVMVTIGLLFVMEEIVPAVWGDNALNLGEPFGRDSVDIGGVLLAHTKLWGIGFAVVGLGLFFLIDRFTKIGIAMRAVHFDQEAAVAQGIPTGLVFAVAWGLAGAVAALAGVIEASGSGQLDPAVGLIASLAFPAMILGGFDSPGGAVVGGLIIGVVQNLFLTYQPEWLGAGFDQVGIFLVMIVVLMVRPYGLFGTPEVRRV